MELPIASKFLSAGWVVLRIVEGEGSAAVREPKRGPNSLDGKSEKKPTKYP